MLFSAAELRQENRAGVMASWLELLRSCQLGMNVFIGDIDSPLGYANSRLLSIARAIEAIARRKYPIPTAAMAQYEERLLEANDTHSQLAHQLPLNRDRISELDPRSLLRKKRPRPFAPSDLPCDRLLSLSTNTIDAMDAKPSKVVAAVPVSLRSSGWTI
jgi:hypothetical protein